MINFTNKITKLFPLWAILFSICALIVPNLFVGFKSLIVPFLTVIMFTMGLTLTMDDFVRVLQNPKIISIGVLLQYLVMPLVAYIISKLFGLTNELLVGMVLVGSVAGGTASNVICYLAGGDVALSVTMTMVSTLIAFILTPLLTLFYAGEYVPVPVFEMLISILKIVLFPLIGGILLNKYMPNYITKCKGILPLISMMAIVFIVAIVVALNKEKLVTIGFILVLAVVLHNLIGLTCGYYVCRFFGYNKKICRTVSIEVGMQNSGLAVALASKYFTSLSALPGAVFSVWHNVSGSFLAGYWANDTIEKNEM